MKTGLEYLTSKEKRAVDIIGSIILSAPALAVSGMASVALRKETGSLKNAFFRQERMSKDDQRILVSKLRTLSNEKIDAEEMVTFGTFDPRAGKIGSFVRQIGIDETPQIFDVLKGKMSLVGPRPLIQDDIEKYEKTDPALFNEWHSIYSSINPGLCGPSQILRHSNYTFDDPIRRKSMELDIEYAQTATLSNDIEIMASTPLDIITATLNAKKSQSRHSPRQHQSI